MNPLEYLISKGFDRYVTYKRMVATEIDNSGVWFISFRVENMQVNPKFGFIYLIAKAWQSEYKYHVMGWQYTEHPVDINNTTHPGIGRIKKDSNDKYLTVWLLELE